MNSFPEQHILKFTGANSITRRELVQSLWSNFGSLERLWLDGYKQDSIIIKRISPPTEMNHPRGWNSDVSSRRKIKSYEIERHWYEVYAQKLPPEIKVPEFLFQTELHGETILGMEDLHTSGFNQSFSSNEKCFDRCLEWLARFHAFHLNHQPEGLREVGTYWHLDTRREEWEAMESGDLKNAAEKIDQKLKQCKYQTLVHGDAKPANFCFTADYDDVAAVDFQYVGRGCGIKDLVYYMSSALSESQLLAGSESVVQKYFEYLEFSLQRYRPEFEEFAVLKKEWMDLIDYAWADFIRFLEGWAPKSRRIHEFTSKKVQSCLGEDPNHQKRN